MKVSELNNLKIGDHCLEPSGCEGNHSDHVVIGINKENETIKFLSRWNLKDEWKIQTCSFTDVLKYCQLEVEKDIAQEFANALIDWRGAFRVALDLIEKEEGDEN